MICHVKGYDRWIVSGTGKCRHSSCASVVALQASDHDHLHRAGHSTCTPTSPRRSPESPHTLCPAAPATAPPHTRLCTPAPPHPSRVPHLVEPQCSPATAQLS